MSCTQCRPPLSVTRLDSFPPVSYSIEAPCSLQSTADSLCFASPLVCSLSTRCLYRSTRRLYRSTRRLSHLAQCYLSTSLTSSPLRCPYRWDLCLCSDSPLVIVSIDTQVYPIVGSRTPPPDLARCRLSLLSTFYSLSTPSPLLLFDLAGLLSSTICPGS